MGVIAATQFEAFWRVYPSRRPHTNPKKTAREKFTAAIKRGIDPQAIIEGAKRYGEYTQREGTNPQFIKQAKTWLNQECWTEDHGTQTRQAGSKGVTMADLEKQGVI